MSERVLEAVRHWPGLDDDELAERLGMPSRQQVNQAARRLEGQGLICRAEGAHGKLVNYPVEQGGAAAAELHVTPRRSVGSERQIALVGCVKQKQERAAPAGELYVSALFRKRVRYVEGHCTRWFVLSAKHGLVDPSEVLEPYDATLKVMPAPARRVWSRRVLRQLEERLGDLAGLVFELHAGREYWGYGLRAGLEAAGAVVEYPMVGLGIGAQLAWYERQRSYAVG